MNRLLGVGWKLIDKHVITLDSPDQRNEMLHFVLAWQSEELPPGEQPPAAEPYEIEIDDGSKPNALDEEL